MEGLSERPTLVRRGVMLTSATVVSATLGWLIMVAVGRDLGPTGFARFSVAWAVFFGIGGTFAGLQQEATRSAVRGTTAPAPGHVRVLAGSLVAVLAAAGVVALSSPWWARPSSTDRLRPPSRSSSACAGSEGSPP